MRQFIFCIIDIARGAKYSKADFKSRGAFRVGWDVKKFLSGLSIGDFRFIILQQLQQVENVSYVTDLTWW